MIINTRNRRCRLAHSMAQSMTLAKVDAHMDRPHDAEVARTYRAACRPAEGQRYTPLRSRLRRAI
jgi:hypothetical protein